MSARLELQGVRAGYGATTILRDVDVIAPAGHVTALLGSNGAGKTTLLRTASGLLRPSRGRVVLDGEDVTRLPPHALARRGLCHIPEGRAVFPSLTVRENLRLHDHGKVDDALERAVGAFPALGSKLTQMAGTLSGGEQQMLALARAYVTAPRYVLLDEVSMGLAPIIVAEIIFPFLRRLAEEGVALLIVEQYVHQVLAIADIVYVLSKGAIVFVGEPCETDADSLAAEYLGAGTG
jgi:branched-chain amino acid transport system ATP-binding protein